MANYSIFMRFSAETATRLYDNLPDKPYCSNDFTYGLKIRSKKTAFSRYTYLQLNRYYATAYLIFDVDRAGAAFAWEDADLLVPTFIVINLENLHAHLVYELFTPVLLWENARQKPIQWLNAIRRAYTEALSADAGYNGLICKNPNHDRWSILDFGGRYELVELSESVEVQQRHFTPPLGFREDFASEGRNNFLFEMGRFYGYRRVHECQSRSELYHTVYARIDNLNQSEFADPLKWNEVRHIAKSISKWTWENRATISVGYQRKTTDEELKEIRSANAHQTAEIKRAATEAKITKAIDQFLRAGRRINKAAIAREAGISREAVSRYYSHLF